MLVNPTVEADLIQDKRVEESLLKICKPLGSKFSKNIASLLLTNLKLKFGRDIKLSNIIIHSDILRDISGVRYVVGCVSDIIDVNIIESKSEFELNLTVTNKSSTKYVCIQLNNTNTFSLKVADQVRSSIDSLNCSISNTHDLFWAIVQIYKAVLCQRNTSVNCTRVMVTNSRSKTVCSQCKKKESDARHQLRRKATKNAELALMGQLDKIRTDFRFHVENQLLRLDFGPTLQFNTRLVFYFFI